MPDSAGRTEGRNRPDVRLTRVPLLREGGEWPSGTNVT